MFDVHRLRLLRELAARGTIAATAQACSLTASAVSQQLAQLQREAGVALLIRDGRHLALTEAARVLVARAERILAELERAEAEIAALSTSVSGLVRIGAFPTAASSLVPAAIAASRAEHPELKVLMQQQETREGILALKAGHVDLLLLYEYNQLPRVADPGIELTPLLTEPLLAAIPPSLDRGRDQVRFADLAEQPWIAPDSDAELRTCLEQACGQAGFVPQLDHISDDCAVALAFVAAGLGVSLVPPLAAESASADVRLRRVREPRLSRRVSVAARAGGAQVPSLAVLIENLRAAARSRDLPADDSRDRR
jgi:DNA-binding transcriptional LysR family regulator